MPRPTKGELFDQARQYLDTDDLNFPDSLLDIMLQRIWFQAVTMERAWRFFQQRGTVAVVAGQSLVPFTFTVTPLAVAGVRILTVSWREPLPWIEYTTGYGRWHDETGEPVAWSELNTGPQRNLRLFPASSMDGTLTVDFYAEPVYPVVPEVGFADLPGEFDGALLEGLLSDMYFREEDPDLGDMHRQMFLEQMGSIRNRWRTSIDTPIVLGGAAVAGGGGGRHGFKASGAYTLPTAG